jgi:hypothetical protein
VSLRLPVERWFRSFKLKLADVQRHGEVGSCHGARQARTRRSPPGQPLAVPGPRPRAVPASVLSELPVTTPVPGILLQPRATGIPQCPGSSGMYPGPSTREISAGDLPVLVNVHGTVFKFVCMCHMESLLLVARVGGEVSVTGSF